MIYLQHHVVWISSIWEILVIHLNNQYFSTAPCYFDEKSSSYATIIDSLQLVFPIFHFLDLMSYLFIIYYYCPKWNPYTFLQSQYQQIELTTNQLISAPSFPILLCFPLFPCGFSNYPLVTEATSLKLGAPFSAWDIQTGDIEILTSLVGQDRLNLYTPNGEHATLSINSLYL